MCMTILVGRSASSTGLVLVGHNEDAPGRYVMQTHKEAPSWAVSAGPVKVGKSAAGLLWSEALCALLSGGASFCDLYVNSEGVAICSNNCADSREDAPELEDGGIGYMLRRRVAEVARSACDAVDVAAELVGRWGYASSGRSYAFADSEEIYVMQIVHGKHWAVHRVPDDEVAVIPNHYTIHEPDKHAPGYEELVSYAVSRGWKNDTEELDFARVYQSPESWGLDKNTYRHVRAFEILLDMDLSALHNEKWQGLPFSVKPSRKVSIDTMKKILRSHDESNPHFTKPLTICNTETLESTIIQMRHNSDRIILRRALGQPSYSPYVVWYFGIPKVPDGYEYSNPKTALADVTKHFTLKPEAMDWRNNAWFRAQEINAVSELLGQSVEAEIEAFEKREEHELQEIDGQIELSLHHKPDIARAIMEGFVMRWTDNAETLAKTLHEKLRIITGESLNAITEGAAFRVRLHDVKLSELDADKCLCGTSCSKYEDWSKCAGINESEGYIEFAPGEWLKDACPCFTDLYMLLVDKTGNRRAGCVKAQVRR